MAIIERTLQIAEYIKETKCTIRQAAEHFKISKSYVYDRMTEHLPKISHNLSREIAFILAYNKSVRHIRGGMATKKKSEK